MVKNTLYIHGQNTLYIHGQNVSKVKLNFELGTEKQSKHISNKKLS
jgi:hypothetical protein